MMYKVLIAEDDLLVRMGIKSSVDWSRYNMEVVSDVCNGQLAWDSYQNNQADLIITDIKMPLMDGIQLIEKIREKDNKCKIVILTCVEEFESARKATSLNVSDYILKLTMTPQELDNVVAKIKKELDERAESSNCVSVPEISVEKIFYNYIYYKQYSEQTLFEMITKRKIDFYADNIVACIMEIDRYPLLKKLFEDENGSLTAFAVLNMVNELLEPLKGTISFHEQGSRYILLFSYFKINNEQAIFSGIRNTLDRIQSTLALYFDVTVSFSVSGIGHSLDEIYPLILQARKILAYKYFIKQGAIMFFTQTDISTIHAPIFNQFQAELEAGELPDELKRELLANIRHFCQEKKFDKESFSKKVISLYQITTGHDKGLEKSVCIELADFMEKINQAEFYREALDIFFTQTQMLFHLQNKEKSFGKEINRVILYLNRNYQKPFNLKEISIVAGYSPNYLSSFFKSELSVTMVEYLNQIRIEKAKELLTQTNLKSYEIAAEVGFKDESYFSRTFKKITGIRPNEYKRQHIHI